MKVTVATWISIILYLVEECYGGTKTVTLNSILNCREYELDRGDTLYIKWNGQYIGDCSVKLDADEKFGESLEICIEKVLFDFAGCQNTLKYYNSHMYYGWTPIDTYTCTNSPTYADTCTGKEKGMLKLKVKQFTNTRNNFKLKVTARTKTSFWSDTKYDDFASSAVVTVGTIIGVVIGLVVLVVAVVIIIICCCCCRKSRTSGGQVYHPPAQAAVTTATYTTQAYPAQTAPGAYPPAQGAYPMGTHPPPQGAYPQPQGAYPPPQGAYPQPQGAYPPPQGAYPPPQGSYPPPQSDYPQTHGAYPPAEPLKKPSAPFEAPYGQDQYGLQPMGQPDAPPPYPGQ